MKREHLTDDLIPSEQKPERISLTTKKGLQSKQAKQHSGAKKVEITLENSP